MIKRNEEGVIHSLVASAERLEKVTRIEIGLVLMTACCSASVLIASIQSWL
jgi:hypothetical protein